MIRTERLIIRKFKDDDWKDLQDYVSLEEHMAFESPWDTTDEGMKKECDWLKGADTFFAVEDQESGKMIGHVYFAKVNPMHFNHYMIGYIFNPKFGARGLATEAVKAVMKYGFMELKAHRIFAKCQPDNEKSWRLLERVGMRREGLSIQSANIRQDKEGIPIWWDEYQYAILDHEFKR